MKTSFRRQMTLIICVLLAATTLIGISFWVLFSRNTTEEKLNDMKKTADSVVQITAAYSAFYLRDSEFRTNLAVAAAASNSDVVICTPDGQVCICAEDLQRCPHIGHSIGQKTADSIFENGMQTVSEEASRIYGDERLGIAVPVTAGNGVRVCIVMVSMEHSKLSALTARAFRIFLLSALVVLALTLLAMPYLTRRETNPVRNMAAAARQIARGDLTVRVPTGNQNEEIEELAVAFNNMTVALQNSERVRQEFVANVSHELKTPMTTIAGYLDGMLDGTIPEEKTHEYMERVATEARRLSRLVRNMLEVSRLKDQGIPQDKLTDFDICEAAGQALLCFEQPINRKNLYVEVDMPELGLTVHAMADAITQVLHNLIENAVKFSDEGGTLSIRVLRRGSSAVVSVGNTGPTIPPEELPLLFDRFHKTDKSRSTDRDGVGLGLYIVKTIINAHGEDIFVTSQNGRTEFTFTLSLKKT